MFTEAYGGNVVDRYYKEVLRVNVDEMTTEESVRVMQCILKALNEEFKRD